MSDSDRAARVQSWFSGKPAGPFMVQLNPTMACNLNCLFCRRQDGLREYYRDHKELSDGKYLEIVEDAIALGVRAINIKGGGEPLLRRSLVKRLVGRIKGAGMSGSLITNGTIIDEEFAGLFASSGWDEISISLDGPDAATQDYLRDKAGVFERIMASLRRLNAAKAGLGRRLPVLKFHLVLTNRNHLSLERLAGLAAESGVEELEIDSLNAGAAEAAPLALSPADRLAFEGSLPGAAAAADALGLRHNLRDFFKRGYVSRAGAAAPAPAAAGAAGTVLDAACLFPWFHANITSDGRLAPCCYGESHRPDVDLHRVSFKEAWLGEAMGRIRRSMLDGSMMPFCADCTPGYRDHSARVRALAAAPVPGAYA